MFYKKPLLFFIFIIISLKAFSTVFTVTSNADSGPGTLRDALTQAAANGTTTTDYIYFNLSDLSVAGRTILLVTQLPDVSSNLVIDGTTQAGPTFGQSHAHVKISTPNEDSPFIVFNGSNVNNIAFYGLYLYDHENITNYTPNTKPRYGINLQHTSNISIGAANKGNLIKGFYTNTIFFDYSDSITLQGNIIGLTDANDLSEGISSYMYFLRSSNLTIGGATLAEGNIIFTDMEITFDRNADGGTITIDSNNFGAFRDPVTGQLLLLTQTISINTLYINEQGATQQDLATRATANISIDNNELSTDFIGFRINGLNGNIDFAKNFLGIDRDRLTPIDVSNVTSYVGSQMNIYNCSAQINVGTTNLSDENYFGYCEIGVNIFNSENVFVRNNEYQCLVYKAYSNDNAKGLLPKVAITGVNSANAQSKISGTADPAAVIDIYSSESCTYSHCSIRKYIQTVIADNAGNWTSGVFNLTGIFYVSATVGNRTSEYKTFEVNSDNAVVTNLRCTNTATITGLQVPSGISYYWTDANGNIVSTSLNLTTSTPGKYQLNLAGGCISSSVFEIDDNRIVISDNGMVKTDASCQNSNGSIKNLSVYDPLFKVSGFAWKDENGNIVGTTTDVSGLGYGNYSLTVSTTDGCSVTYGPVNIKNTTGPNIDQSKVAIQSTNCGQSTGSITNLAVTGTGTLKFIWWNGQQQTVSTTQDLLNQPAGTYKLEVTDDSQCGPVYTADLTIPETNGITMDESKAQTTVASCSNNNGSVTGITVAGASQYQWLDANNKVVGTAADLQNVAPGTYTLTASNSFGCSATSKPYTVGQLPPTKFPIYMASTSPACFQQTDGSISVTVDASVKSVRWVNASGQDAGTNVALTDVGGGPYQLYLTDQNGCENYYNTYTVAELPEYQVVSSGAVTNDQCNLGVGSISAADIEGGLPPYTYTWYNSNNQQIGTGPSISNLTAGTYTLNVISSRCGESNTLYTVANETTDVAAPSVSNVALCSSGNAIITVNNPSSSTVYRLYANQTDTQPLAEQKGGTFIVNVAGNTIFYVSQLNGSCESARAEVMVTVGLSALNIANTFTPNGDGINDFWVINGITNYPAAEVQVFTRNGQRIFDSKGYATPFDGTYNGKNLPEGVYYYIIDLHSNCSLLSGSLTIIR
ncbi:MAG TPA: gliding motility-associated C-terminal domain-containing protein [Mucilaginibacter sp.]|jgi:gliding motility-associated-like protein|nr:gliding motility-associated C-terminal domain-containing protein [Mucilaginibacter sp.]